MSEVPQIRHRRWRHKSLRYVVQVLGTRNTGCPTVTVDRTQFTLVKRTWNVEKFLLDFEPIGRPVVARSIWELL